MRLNVKHKFLFLILFIALFFSSHAYASYSLYFDGSDSVNAGNVPVVSNEITIEAWVSPTSYDNLSWIVSKYDDWGGQASYGLAINPGGTVGFTFAGLGGQNIVNSSVTIPLNQYSYVVATYNGSVAKIYIGSLEDTSLTTSSVILPSSADFVVGQKSGSPPENFYGYIDSVAVYPYAFSKQQVQSQYKAGANSFLSGAYVAYDFEEGSGTTAVDKSGNGYNGIITGATYIDSAAGNSSSNPDTALLAQIRADLQTIKDQLTAQNSMDWNKSMSFLAGLLASISVVAAARMRL